MPHTMTKQSLCSTEGADRIGEQLQAERHPRLVVMPPGGFLVAPEGMQYKLVIHSPMQDWPARYGPVTGIPPTAYQVRRQQCCLGWLSTASCRIVCVCLSVLTLPSKGHQQSRGLWSTIPRRAF